MGKISKFLVAATFGVALVIFASLTLLSAYQLLGTKLASKEGIFWMDATLVLALWSWSGVSSLVCLLKLVERDKEASLADWLKHWAQLNRSTMLWPLAPLGGSLVLVVAACQAVF